MTAASVRASGFGYHAPGREAAALAGLDLTIPGGERVLLLGDSGSGKSTLLRAMAGLLDAGGTVTGSLQIDGTPAPLARRRVGLLLQDPEVQLVLPRAGEDVAFGPQNRGCEPAEVEKRVLEALAGVGFPYPPDRAVSQLSGGERQRLALAGVLALQPDVLLLDEPTSMLDPQGAELVREAVFRVVSERGLTLVVVEHRVEHWLDLVDRVMVLSPEGLVADGPPTKVRRDPLAQLTWLGSSPQESLSLRRPVNPSVRLLVADQVGLRYAGMDSDALRPVSTTLSSGSALWVSGANGSGKSTLARLLTGLVRPTTGEVLAEPELTGAKSTDRRPDRWSARALVGRIGMVFQNPEHSFLTDSVRKELEVGPRACRLPASTVDDRVEELLGRLRLRHLVDANPYTLSGGEQRRLSVAAALGASPRILVLDEPTFGQDPSTWCALVDLLTRHRQDGGALAVMSHDIEFGKAVCDQRLVLARTDQS